jgi:cold shock CspA family protein
VNISNECKTIKAVGKIEKIHSDLSFGMVITKNKQKVFFSDETIFGAFQFRDFKIGDEVDLEFIETDRGLFARELKKIL